MTHLISKYLSRISLGTICVVFLLLIITGAKTFTVSAQMREIYQYSQKWHFQIGPSTGGLEEIAPAYSQEMNYDLGRLLWFPRKVIIFPMVFVHHATGLDIHFSYSLEIFILLIATSFLLAKVMTIYSRSVLARPISLMVAAHISLLFFLLLSLVMNGRMVFAFLAMTLLMYIHAAYCIEKPKLPILIFPLLFLMFLCASSSTGVYSVAYSAAIVLILGNYPNPFADSKHRFSLVIMFFAAAAWFLLGIYKNLLYFGGDMTRVFTHGFGSQLPKFDTWALYVMWGLLLGVIAAAGWTLIHFRRLVGPHHNLVRSPFVALGILTLDGFVGGFFGYSTLTTAIPPLLVASLLLFKKATDHWRRHLQPGT